MNLLLFRRGARPGFGFAATVAALFLAACSGFGQLDDSDEVDRLTPIGGTSDNETVTLDSARGQPIEVNFDKPPRPLLVVFTTLACNSCRQDAPSVTALAEFYNGKVDVLGVQLDLTAADAQRYGQDRAGYPVAWDPSKRVARAMRVERAPAFVLLTTEGKIAERDLRLSYKLRERIQELVKSADSGAVTRIERSASDDTGS